MSSVFLLRQFVKKQPKKDYLIYGKTKVVGFCLNEDLITEPFEDSIKIAPKMNPIFSILGELDKRFLKNKKKIKKRFFHLFMVGSLKEYRNKGIAKKLTAKSLALARKRGFKEIVSEATNLKSQNLLRKYFGFNDIEKIIYKNFEFNNQLLFKDIGEESCNLMRLKLR